MSQNCLFSMTDSGDTNQYKYSLSREHSPLREHSSLRSKIFQAKKRTKGDLKWWEAWVRGWKCLKKQTRQAKARNKTLWFPTCDINWDFGNTINRYMKSSSCLVKLYQDAKEKKFDCKNMLKILFHTQVSSQV